jgi:hypothetical protein
MRFRFTTRAAGVKITPMLDRDYLDKLKQRAKRSRVSRKFQWDGLEIAKILGDEKHKSLYIKLAKEWGGDTLRRLAKEIAENKNIKRKGAYFMIRLKKLKTEK